MVSTDCILEEGQASYTQLCDTTSFMHLLAYTHTCHATYTFPNSNRSSLWMIKWLWRPSILICQAIIGMEFADGNTPMGSELRKDQYDIECETSDYMRTLPIRI